MTTVETKAKPFTITTTVEITPQRIADMMCTAIEGNDMTRAWCAGIRLAGPHKGQEAKWKTEQNYPWYCNDALYASDDFQIEIREIVDESKPVFAEGNLRRHLCGRAEFQAGLQLMAEKYAHHFRDLVEENDDAITGDVFIQCIALKEVVYG